MRICHVTDFLPDLHKIAGGAEFAVKRVLDEQIGMGLDVHVVTAKREVADRLPPGNSAHEMRRLDRLAPGAAFVVKNFFVPVDPLAARDLQRALEAIAPDVVHFHNLHFSSLQIMRRARRLGIPTALTIYDYWTVCPSFMLLTSDDDLCTRGHGAHCVDCIGTRRARWSRPIKRALFRARKPIFERMLGYVDRLVVLSEASKRIMVRHGFDSERVHVVPQYLWKEAAERPQSTSTVPGRLVYVGWVERRKGLHVVVDALRLAAGKHPDLHLHVLGLPADAEYQREIETVIEREGLHDRVTFVGKVSRDDMLRALDEAFLVMIPEQWENMSPVILTEAMAAGRCVLASRVGGIPGFVQEFESGLLAARDSAAEFAERMTWAMEHQDQVAQIARRAKDRAREAFAPDMINRRWHELYQSLIRNPENDATRSS